jgi:hypothetical protein
VGQGDHDTDARDRHQPPRNLIVAGSGKDLPVEHRYLVPNGVPHGKQRLDDRNESSIAGDLLTYEFPSRGSVDRNAAPPTLER